MERKYKDLVSITMEKEYWRHAESFAGRITLESRFFKMLERLLAKYP